jgi:hypothetical protein
MKVAYFGCNQTAGTVWEHIGYSPLQQALKYTLIGHRVDIPFDSMLKPGTIFVELTEVDRAFTMASNPRNKKVKDLIANFALVTILLLVVSGGSFCNAW